ncbi:DMT family transporter [Dermacoccus nishinomiyaensis]|uniref:DMT family transporter n=1 Tax=Dermacoccus nishinomiyaensis TaxID=1274 RepID=UPI001C93161B|nr:DMT family transporter [Dermacoccus nishinomiyaensis]
MLTILSLWHSLGGSSATGQLACLAATACYGLGFTYLRKQIAPRGLPALAVACAQVSLGAIVMLVLTPFAGRGEVPLSWRVVLSMLALGAPGTGMAYVWNTNVVSAWGPTNASSVTYLTPVVGVVFGVIFLGEHMTWSEPIGAVLVVLGIVVSHTRLKRLTSR